MTMESPYGKDRVFLYDHLDALRDALGDVAEDAEDSERQNYLWGMVDMLGFLMVNHPEAINDELVASIRATAGQLADAFAEVLRRGEWKIGRPT